MLCMPRVSRNAFLVLHFYCFFSENFLKATYLICLFENETGNISQKSIPFSHIFPWNSTDFSAKISPFLPILWKTNDGKGRIS